MLAAQRNLILRGGIAPCPQAVAFLARSQLIDSRHRAAYITLINGLVAAGVWSLFDALWIFATQNSQTSFLNLCSSSFAGALFTASVAASFTADQGWTTTSTGVLAPNWNPSTGGVVYTQDSGSMGVYVLTNDTANTTKTEMGAATSVGNKDAELNANFSLVSKFIMNDGTFSSTVASTTSKGLWAISRTASNARAMYGSSGSSTAIISDTQASTGLGTNGLIIGARNIGAGISNPTSHQYAAAWVGAGITGAQYATISFWINQYMKTMGCNVF